jgi:hypothetical protein
VCLEFQAYRKTADIKKGMNLTPWQRSNILAAVNYLKDSGKLVHNPQAVLLAQGLMEVLDPSRRTIRLQREAAQAATAGAQAGRERRLGRDRRASDRRKQQLPFEGPNRRSGRDRRLSDRRSG